MRVTLDIDVDEDVFSLLVKLPPKWTREMLHKILVEEVGQYVLSRIPVTISDSQGYAGIEFVALPFDSEGTAEYDA